MITKDEALQDLEDRKLDHIIDWNDHGWDPLDEESFELAKICIKQLPDGCMPEITITYEGIVNLGWYSGKERSMFDIEINPNKKFPFALLIPYHLKMHGIITIESIFCLPEILLSLIRSVNPQ